MTAAAGDLDDGPLLPGYGSSTLADLSQSLLGALGVPGTANVLGLPLASRVCLLVVDGLGWELLRAHRAAAPFLSGLAETGCWLAAGFPATTVTSLSSLGTGQPPGQHGMLGYQVRVPATGKLLNSLRWDASVDPLAWQPGPTIFELAAEAGLGAYRIAAGAFRDSGLSVAAMRGADYRSADTPGALVARTAAALAEQPRALAMVYTGDLDATGHAWGCGSPAWRYQLSHVDRLAEQLAGALPARRCTSRPTTAWWMFRLAPVPTLTPCRSCAPASRSLAVRAVPGTSTPCPVPPRTCWPRGAVRSVTARGSRIGKRQSTRAGSVPSTSASPPASAMSSLPPEVRRPWWRPSPSHVSRGSWACTGRWPRGTSGYPC